MFRLSVFFLCILGGTVVGLLNGMFGFDWPGRVFPLISGGREEAIPYGGERKDWRGRDSLHDVLCCG